MDTEKTLDVKSDADLDGIIASYLKAAEAGAAPNHEELIVRYPAFARELSAFFANQKQFQRAAEPVRAGLKGSPPAGTKIRYFGDYELLEEIGRGGMGVVYKAKQVSLNRTVALKMILTGELANEADVRRFHAEAEAAAKLDHPGIVSIFEVGQHEGHHYFSMAFVESESLAHKIVQGLLPPRAAAEMIRKVAEAVAYAHVEGVIHRDLKPANILIDRNGQPRLTDFGLAKRLQSETGASVAAGLTATGQILGTPSYMPPEQARGERGGMGPAADVYSLGAVLYCLLTGRPPFQAANPLDTLLQVLDSEPVLPRQLDSAAPRDLETICLKCLNKEPRKRYGSAQDLIRDLDRFLAGQPIVARPTGPAERLGKWVKRRPAAAALLLLVGLIAIGLPILLMAMLHNAEDRAQAVQDLAVAERDLNSARSATENQQQLTRKAQTNLNNANQDLLLVRKDVDQQKKLAGQAMRYSQGLRLIGQSSALRVNNPGLALLLALEGQKLAPGLMANNALREAIEECHEERTIRLPDGCRSAFYSPDGKVIVSFNWGKVRFWNPASGTQVAELDPPLSIASATFSPDNKRIVFTFQGHNRHTWQKSPTTIIYTDRVARVWDLMSRKEVAVLKGHKSYLASARFSPDGKKLATASWDGTVRIWDTSTWKEDRVIAAYKDGASAALFSPDGQSILTVPTDYHHKRSEDVDLDKLKNALLDPPTGTLPPGVKPGDGGGSGSSSSNSSFPVKKPSPMIIWDAATGKERKVLKRPPGRFFNESFAAWSPDGDQVLNRDTLWDVATGEVQVSLSFSREFRGGPPSDHIGRTLFNPSGTRVLAVAQDKLYLFYSSTGKEAVAIRVPMGIADVPSFSPDGRWLLCICADRAVRLWSADTGEELACFRGHEITPSSATFSPDGKRVVTAAEDGTIRIWTMQLRKDYGTVLPGNKGRHMVVFSPDGRLVATAGGRPHTEDPEAVQIWDARTGQRRHLLQGLEQLGSNKLRNFLLGKVVAIQFSHDGRRLLVASRELFGRSQGGGIVDRILGTPPPGDLPFTPVRIWDVKSGKVLTAFPGHRAAPAFAAFSPDGKKVVTGEERQYNRWTFSGGGGYRGGGSLLDPSVYIWDAETGKLLHTLRGNDQNDLAFAAWSPDGKRILMGEKKRSTWESQTRIWEVATRKPVATLNLGQGQGRYQLAGFSPDGKQVLLFFEWQNGIGIWDAASGELVRPLGIPSWGMGQLRPEYDPKANKQVYKTTKGRVIDIPPEGEKMANFATGINQAAYSPDGCRIVISSRYKTASVWEAATGKGLVVLRGHIGGVRQATFSADGKRIVTASDDDTARVWDAATGEELFTLAGHKGPVVSAVFSPDGKFVATASADGTARIWPLDPVPLALSRKPRELTPEERERFGAGIPEKK